MRSLILILALCLTACGDNLSSSPDGGLPSCASVGCPTFALCNSSGVCVCAQSDGGHVQCVRSEDGG